MKEMEIQQKKRKQRKYVCNVCSAMSRKLDRQIWNWKGFKSKKLISK